MVSSKKKKSRSPVSSSCILAATAVILCGALLSAMVSDCENYSSDESVSCAITYTPPEEVPPSGFWDVFSQAISRLLLAGV